MGQQLTACEKACFNIGEVGSYQMFGPTSLPEHGGGVWCRITFPVNHKPQNTNNVDGLHLKSKTICGRHLGGIQTQLEWALVLW